MSKYFRIAIIVMAIMAALTGTASALDAQWHDVTLTIDNITQSHRTKAQSVGEFLAENSISLAINDTINIDENTILSDNKSTSIVIDRGFDVTVRIDTKAEIVAVAKGTKVGNLIRRLVHEREEEYIYDGIYAELLKPNKEIVLKTRTVETLVTKEQIGFETEIILDDKLEKDKEEIIQEGANGEKIIVTEVVFIGGVEDSRTVINEQLSAEPTNLQIRRGTAKKLSAFELLYGKRGREIIMSATAYTAGYESTGKNPGDPGYGITASGMPVRHGVVAVDPRVIPLGTKLYIEGYGDAIAADTGGAIVGNRIDLFYESLRDARNFGRKSVKVYIME